MKRDEAFPSKFLRSTDLNGPCRAIIGRLESDKIGDDKKYVLYFSRAQQDIVKDKGLVLNATNWDIIAGMHGEDSDDWHSCEITLYATTVMVQGKRTPCIRVDDRPQQMTTAKPQFASGLPQNGNSRPKPSVDERNPPDDLSDEAGWR